MKRHLYTFEGAQATVTWDRERCIHFAACVRGLPEAFDTSRRPWIEPDAAEPGPLDAVIRRCPTGALHLRLPDGTDPEPIPAASTVRVAPDGPLYLHGQVSVRDSSGNEVLRDTRVALCRCGRSANKPLCDNAHREDFSDPGLLSLDVLNAAAAPTSVAPDGASLVVTPRVDGPLNIEGAFTLKDAAGATVTRLKASLCRCGASANKPFCDGSHKRIGFRAP